MMDKLDLNTLATKIKAWGKALRFQAIGITRASLDDEDLAHLQDYIQAGRHGEMEYMARNIKKRCQPDQLLANTVSIISVRMDYLPPDSRHPITVLHNPKLAYVSRYATGRDYHKVLRKRLQKLAHLIEENYSQFGYRCFTDSAPILEKALARNAGLGWIGKHSNLIHPKAGSWFFLGEIYSNLPLAPDKPFTQSHCGRCQACIDVCPTQAIVAPMQVDARRCISYLTIELRGSIPIPLRKLIGNRVYGCDDCQLICPWNKFAQNTDEHDFRVRNGLDAPTLVSLFAWTKSEFYRYTEGSAIRRIGYDCWLRNVAVGLGNAPTSTEIIDVLLTRTNSPSALVREHVHWALAQHGV